jgi:hypothetical protein
MTSDNSNTYLQQHQRKVLSLSLLPTHLTQIETVSFI